MTESESLHGSPVSWSRGQKVVHPSRQTYVALLKKLLDDGFTMCTDLTAVDYLTHPGRELPAGVEAERFEVVVNLIAIASKERLRVRVQVPESDPTIASAFDLWPGTEAMEREAFDMFGIRFEGHPDLTRILMPEDWEGHPLRKDYAVGRIPVQFKGAHS
ncbi:MAG: NADH-quinone oxidoreductase subunit C [Ilumatobacteraceae bacterium]